MLQIKNLKKTYNKTEVLTDITYIFNKGQIYPILGCNGSGRTTLFECIVGDLVHDSGEILTKENCKIVIAAKQSVLPMNLTGYEFVQFLCKEGNPEDYLEQIHLEEGIRHKLIKDYDFMSKKKLQLALFLIKKPYVMMFDEPFDYCDEQYIDEFLEVLNTMKDEHVILISTGFLEIANKISEDAVILNNGELNQVSTESLKIPEIKKAVMDILGENENEELI